MHQISDEDKKGVDEVDGTKSKLGNRASRFQAAVHRAREKLKRESSRSGSSSEDSEDISTSEEEIDDQTPSRLGDINNRGYVLICQLSITNNTMIYLGSNIIDQ